MNHRENTLKAYKFDYPEKIPARMGINPGCWNYYGVEALERLVLEHRLLFSDFVKGSIDARNIAYKPYEKANTAYTDSWGCVWKSSRDGIVGTVIHHPLKGWDKFELYKPPNPLVEDGMETIDWHNVEIQFDTDRKKGNLLACGLRHGFFLLRLMDLLGYENAIYSMHDEEPDLMKLLDRIESFNKALLYKYIELGPDMISFPEDLGTQNNLLISPVFFRKYVKSAYSRLMKPVKQNNILVRMHSDGHILELSDDLIECGVDILNIQDRVNGLDNIKRCLKGKVAVDLDIDRQSVTRFGTPSDIDDLIREAVSKLGSREGGLSLSYGLYPGIPLENVKAIMDAMERYSFYYS